jgi:DNA polymerase alpha subunit A
MPESGKPEGILKREIRELVNRRREVKSLMQKAKPGSEQHTQVEGTACWSRAGFYIAPPFQYHIRQMGLKLTANSMYGCLGFEGSRFFAKTLAAMITAKGREILMHAKQLVEAEGHSVIYGDTDSLMINTNKDDVAGAKAIGIQVSRECREIWWWRQCMMVRRFS